MGSRVARAQQPAAKAPDKQDARLAASLQPGFRAETSRPDGSYVPFNFSDVSLFAPGEEPGLAATRRCSVSTSLAHSGEAGSGRG